MTISLRRKALAWGNIIRKYQSFGGDYTDAPADYPLPGENVNLYQAIDLAIDGHIYILLRTGHIYKLVEGKRGDFPVAHLDVPMNNPVSISVSPQNNVEQGHVYVADAGNQRILQFDKFGYLMHQLKPAESVGPWDQLQGIWADERAGRVYYINGSTLYYVNLP